MREGLSWRWLALILLAFCFPLFIALGGTDLENDEAIYSFGVDAILETGDWLSPRSSPSETDVFLEKPPLKMWIVAAPIRLGLLPHNEFGLRFWDALFGAVAFVYVFLIGRRLGGPICGVVAVLVLFAQHRLLFDHGLRSNNMEASLVLAYCGGMYHFLRYADPDERHRGRHVGAIAALFYLAFMTKFVAALFLPVVIGACVLVLPAWRRQVLRDIRHWVAAGVAVLAAIVPWFAYQHVVTDGGIWHVMFGEHVVERFTAFADPEHVQPWYFYFAESSRQLTASGSALLVAWGLPLLAIEAIRRRLPAGILVLAWFILPVGLISVGTSKLYHYLFPYLAPLALAAGYGVAWIVTRTRRWLMRVAPRSTVRLPFHPRGMSTPLLLAAMAALAVAVVTAAHGHVRLEFDKFVLVRNSSVVRPLVVAAVCAALAGHVTAVLAGALVLAVALAVPLPLDGYLANIRELTARRQTLRTLTACLREVDDERRSAGETVRGVYGLSMQDGGFVHQYFYYFRRAGGWEERGPRSDDDIARALFVRGQERPVVLEAKYYSEFLERRPAPPALAAFRFRRIVVALPGPYNRCAAVARLASR